MISSVPTPEILSRDFDLVVSVNEENRNIDYSYIKYLRINTNHHLTDKLNKLIDTFSQTPAYCFYQIAP